jgi:hypothetical protein
MYKMAVLRHLQRVSLLIFLMVISGCGAPIFRSYDERFAPAPELIAQLEPYLEKWATTPPEQTREERREVASKIDGILAILEQGTRVTESGETIIILVIILEEWGDWQRGYFYVHDGSELAEHSSLQLRRVDEHFYIFNRNF